METGWPYDAGTSDIGDWPDEQLADRAAARWQPSLEAPAAPVNVPAPRARTGARAENFPGELAMTDQRRPGPGLGRAGPGQIVLDVWHRLVCRPDGGRWRQRLPRPALVLPGHLGMHRTLDLAIGKAVPHRPGHGNVNDTSRAGNAYTRRPASAGVGPEASDHGSLALDGASTGSHGITKRLRHGLRPLRDVSCPSCRVSGVCAGYGRRGHSGFLPALPRMPIACGTYLPRSFTGLAGSCLHS
jgi:hypothetical protein